MTLPIDALASDTSIVAEYPAIVESEVTPTSTPIPIALPLEEALTQAVPEAKSSTSDVSAPPTTKPMAMAFLPVASESLPTTANTVFSPSIEEVQALIDALPTAEELSDWPIELQKSSYDHFVEVTDAFYSLSFEEQEQIDMTHMIDLSVFYNSATSMAATLYRQATWHTEYFSHSIDGSWYDNTGAYRYWILNCIDDHWIYDTSEGNPCYCIRPDLGEAEYYYYYSSGSGTNAWYNIYWDFLGRIQNDGWLPSWMYDTQEEADTAPFELTFNEATGLYEATITNSSKKVSNSQWYTTMLDEFTYEVPEGITVTRDTSIGNTVME